MASLAYSVRFSESFLQQARSVGGRIGKDVRDRRSKPETPGKLAPLLGTCSARALVVSISPAFGQEVIDGEHVTVPSGTHPSPWHIGGN